MDIMFWDARGSIPSPLSPKELEQKLTYVLVEASGRKFRNEAEAKVVSRNPTSPRRGNGRWEHILSGDHERKRSDHS